MTTLIQTNIAPRSFAAFVRAIVQPVALGLRALQAQKDLNRFRQMEPARLADIGLTRAQADSLTWSDFMAQPRR